nr:hypothetical protein GCM10020063_076260 [Dactylosporangium thailandense]
MRSRISRPLRILIAAGLILTLAFIDHYVFHRSFVYVLVLMVSVFGPMVLWRCLEEAAQRRRTRAQQAPNGAEQDASGE